MKLLNYTIKNDKLTAEIPTSWSKQNFYLMQVDERNIRDKQRKFFFAILNQVADFTGYPPDEFKSMLYSQFESEYGYETTMSLKGNRDDANKLIEILLAVVIDLGLAFGIELSNFDTQEIEHWEYVALKNKFCVICGKQPADVAHVKAVGIGRNRNKVQFSESLAFSLCREHHNEQHNLGIESFMNKYHIYGVEI